MNFKQFITWEKSTYDIVDFKMIYVDMAEDLCAGLLLSQIVYYYLPSKNSKRNKLRVEHGGKNWIAKGREEWWKEIRLTARQIDRAVDILIKAGLIEKENHKFNSTPKMHIRLIEDVFLQLLKDRLNETVKSTSPNGEVQLTEPSNPVSRNGEVQLTEPSSLITKTTEQRLHKEHAQREKERAPDLEKAKNTKIEQWKCGDKCKGAEYWIIWWGKRYLEKVQRKYPEGDEKRRLEEFFLAVELHKKYKFTSNGNNESCRMIFLLGETFWNEFTDRTEGKGKLEEFITKHQTFKFFANEAVQQALTAYKAEKPGKQKWMVDGRFGGRYCEKCKGSLSKYILMVDGKETETKIVCKDCDDLPG